MIAGFKQESRDTRGPGTLFSRGMASLAFLGLALFSLTAESSGDADIPIRRIALFSSGVGYFEHTGTVSGNASAELPFHVTAVNDALKSLVINDPGTASPSVTYPSEDTVAHTLRSLSVDLSGNPGIADILRSLQGAELTISAPGEITGRIVGVETRGGYDDGIDVPAGMRALPRSYLSLLTAGGLRVLDLGEIAAFRFSDPRIGKDLERALDLLMSARDSETRALRVNLPGSGKRGVTLAYVIPAPVWKASYRLDLSSEKPVLQGWAIVDNAGDIDWDGVELSLVSGRPVSFIQNLYPPLNLQRPVLPLSIAGIAEAAVYDSGYGGGSGMKEEAYEEDYSEIESGPPRMKRAAAPSMALMADSAPTQGAPKSMVSAGSLEATTARNAGEQYLFTMKKPVSLARRQSAMFPLVEERVKAERVSVFSGEKAAHGGMIHPLLCAELENTTGMKLPAGPITVFDEGSYAGDSLIEFLSEKDKRILAYGEDLSVTGSVLSSGSTETVGVTISKGVMYITRRYAQIRTYTLKNASARDRKIYVEHPISGGTTLALPAKYEERTDSLYRFAMKLAANSTASLDVREDSPVSETIALIQQKPETLLYYSSSSEIPAKARFALEKAIGFRRAVDDAQTALSSLEARKESRIKDQSRIRDNLLAAGNESQQGREYLKKLGALDDEIDSLTGKIEDAKKALTDAKAAYERYLSSLSLE